MRRRRREARGSCYRGQAFRRCPGERLNREWEGCGEKFVMREGLFRALDFLGFKISAGFIFRTEVPETRNSHCSICSTLSIIALCYPVLYPAA